MRSVLWNGVQRELAESELAKARLAVDDDKTVELTVLGYLGLGAADGFLHAAEFIGRADRVHDLELVADVVPRLVYALVELGHARRRLQVEIAVGHTDRHVHDLRDHPVAFAVDGARHADRHPGQHRVLRRRLHLSAGRDLGERRFADAHGLPHAEPRRKLVGHGAPARGRVPRRAT